MNKYAMIKELSEVPDNFLSACYSVSFTNSGKVIQMKYNAGLAARLKTDLEAEGKIDENGFVCFRVTFREADWEVIMT